MFLNFNPFCHLTRQPCIPSSIGFCLLVALGLERWILFIPRMKMNLASRHVQHHQQHRRRTRSSSQSSMSSTSSVSSAASSGGTVSQNIKKVQFFCKENSSQRKGCKENYSLKFNIFGTFSLENHHFLDIFPMNITFFKQFNNKMSVTEKYLSKNHKFHGIYVTTLIRFRYCNTAV